MGYRSDVGFALPLKEATILNNKFKELNCYNLFENVDNKKEIQFCNETWMIYEWSWLKWYPCYIEVQTIEDYMDKEDSQYCFIRIGEDLNDNEERFNNDLDENIFYVSRVIAFSY